MSEVRVEASCTQCDWSDDGGLTVLNLLQAHAERTGHIIDVTMTPEPVGHAG